MPVALIVFCLLFAPAHAQVRTLHTRDLTRLSQVQVAEALKQTDIIFIPVGAVETNGIQHIDCAIKLIDEETILVKRTPANHPSFAATNNLATILASTPAPSGRNYRVIRLDCPYYSGSSSPPAWASRARVWERKPKAS